MLNLRVRKQSEPVELHGRLEDLKKDLPAG